MLITDTEGCTQEFGPFTVESLVASQDLNIEQRITIYPNPLKGIFNLQLHNLLEKEGHYVVFDVIGNKIQEGSFTDQPNYRISLPNTPAGIYLLRIHLGDQSFSRKIMVMR